MQNKNYNVSQKRHRFIFTYLFFNSIWHTYTWINCLSQAYWLTVYIYIVTTKYNTANTSTKQLWPVRLLSALTSHKRENVCRVNSSQHWTSSSSSSSSTSSASHSFKNSKNLCHKYDLCFKHKINNNNNSILGNIHTDCICSVIASLTSDCFEKKTEHHSNPDECET